jgi:hypothetical protein
MNQKVAISSVFGIVVTILIAGGVASYIYLQSQVPKEVEVAPSSISHRKAHVLFSTPPPVTCTRETKRCPDGSYVGQQGPKCEFAVCPIQKQQTSQGIYGHITIRSGDCKSTTAGSISGGCKLSKVSRKVFIYPLINLRDTGSTGDSYFAPTKELIREVSSDSSGFYQVGLPVGSFSIFVEDSGKKYCNSLDGQGEVCLVTITSREVHEHNIIINYAAD